MEKKEIEKLKKHLSLLREEYVKLQTKYSDMERKYNLLSASTGVAKVNSFVSRLIKTVSSLFDKELYSDLTIDLKEGHIKAHKFVLNLWSDKWGGNESIIQIDHLDWRDIPNEISVSLLKWAYTDYIDLSAHDEDFILNIIKTAKKFSLQPLIEKCEESLMSFVNVRNCVKFYQLADEIEANMLKNHCSELISSYWNDFTREDFINMPTPLLFSMFKAKTEFPLHTAIRIQREDVVFFYLIEFDSQLVNKVNEFDGFNDLPLDLALRSGQYSIAKTLINHKANINAVNKNSLTLLHLAIERKDTNSANFLMEEGASVNFATLNEKYTPLHLVCKQTCSDILIANKLLSCGADPNLQDINGNTCLHTSILSKNKPIFELLLNFPNILLDIRNAQGHTPLALALLCLSEDELYATKLVEKQASIDFSNPTNGNTLLHICALESNEPAGIFLINHGAKVNQANQKGETPLHIASALGLNNLSQALLKAGANCNLTTLAGNLDSESQEVYNQTPLHLAILNKHEEVIKTILSYKSSETRDLASSINLLDVNIKNSNAETSLSLAIQNRLLNIAQLLIDKGANVNIKDKDGYTLLHSTILNNDSRGALFLLNIGVDINIKTPNGETPLQLVVKHQLESVLIDLCSKGADINVKDENGNSPLWTALENNNEDIASILVQYGCDTVCWGEGPGRCWQTLLHRALDENNEFIACFLIRSGCDLNSPRKPSPDGKGEEEAYDGQTPLHMACCWGLENVVQTLLEFGADVNVQDSEGKTSLHIAIINQHSFIISLILSHPALNLNLKDKNGNTPFATAMAIKNNKAAKEILNRDSNAAEKFDSKGFNFLHTAIRKGDIESVLFLLSINVNIHSRVQDVIQATPFHLAVESGSELIVRNLLLAGANIEDVTAQKQTVLHIAAEHDHSAICSILLENKVNFNAVDVNLNNALHLACQKGNLATCKVLLHESQIEAFSCNAKGQTPLHLVASFAKDNGAAIFELFMRYEPKYPINLPDGEGNTPLLLAYINGNVNLCRALVKCGACLGSTNKSNINIFNCQVASNTLLYKLLDFLPQEPKWTDGDSCSECGTKFGIKVRKHHCRHCGRVLCAKCSSKEVTIPKFNLTRPVRVCEVCFDVLVMSFSTT